MTILQFIFQDFWHFIGVLLILEVVFGGLGNMFSKQIIYKKIDKEDKKED